MSNLTATPMDLVNWRLAGQVEYEFPNFAKTNALASFLKPFERVVISSADPAATRAAYKIPTTVRVLGPWIGRLGKTGGRITLKDKNGLVLSTVKYSDRGNWHAAANGTGHCLVLRNGDNKVDDWRNWTVSTRPNITPGTDPFATTEIPVANPELVSQQSGTVLVDYEDVWRFYASNRAVDPKWRETNYNDFGWAQGVGMFGFAPQNAKIPPPGIRTRLPFGLTTYYFRKKFVFTNDTKGLTFVIDQIVDDGAVYYLNGKEVGRVGMPGGNIAAVTPANRNVGDPAEEKAVITVPGNAIYRGTNVLAVELHNVAPNSPDVCFGMRMTIPATVQLAQGAVTINEVFPGPVGKGFVEFYNDGNVQINLKGHYLSSLPANLARFQIKDDLIVRPKAFASVDFSGAGLLTGPPVAVYLTAPDGRTVVNAVREFIPEGRSLGRKPAGSTSWYQFLEPTRDAPNTSQVGLTRSLRLNEIQFDGPRKVDWIELYNPARTNFPLAGLYISSRPDFSDKVPLDGSLVARGYRVFSVPFGVKQEEVTVYVHDGAGLVLDAHVFVVSRHGENFQAFPDGGREWYAGTKPTKGTTNSPARNTDIVINEIMYKPPVTQESSEFVELFNRGKSIVNLTDWALHGGITFKFTEDTKMKPGDYLVVAANASLLRAIHGNINVLGDFKGKLANDGELLRLEDDKGNLVNEVDYRAGGDWPVLAHGGGSSMELINPFMDNSLASAWRDSDESGKAKFKTYYASGLYESNALLNPILPTDINELHFYLVSDGHIILDNVQVLKDGKGTNYIANGRKMSTNGVSASGWLAQGTHWATHITNGQLHLISDGRGDNRANRVEIDTGEMRKGEKFEIRFDAKWVSGSPRLIGHTWDYSLCPSFLIDVPANLGTPGRPNSRALPSAPPQADNLTHSPAVPRSTEVAKVTMQVKSFTPLPPGAVQLFHRLDNENGDGKWTSKSMSDDGLNGDLVAGDGIYTALLPEYRGNGQIVQFYARVAGPGGVSLLPRDGSSLPAMFIIDDQPVARDLRPERFVISAYDLGGMLGGNTNKYHWKFPRLNNHYFNATFINAEQQVYYNAEIHNSGSGYTRGGIDRGKWKLPLDRLFRGHRKLTYDNDPDGQARHHNRLVRYWLYLLGEPVNEAEMVRVYINNGKPMLREETEPVSNDYLKRAWPHGTRGFLYRPEFTWWFRDDWTGGSPIGPSFEYKGSEDTRLYRHVWMKRTREAEDDYTDLISFFKLISANQYTQEEIERVFDPEAVLKHAAARGYSADWDTFTMGGTHNALFYRRPTDGRFQFLHWDSDQGFQANNIPGRFYGGPVQPWLEKYYNKRLFFYYLVELLENYTLDSPRVYAWMQAEEDASNAYTVEAKLYRDFFAGRQTAALKLMGDNYRLPFKITTNGGNPITTTDFTVTLEGQSPYGIYTVIALDQPKVKCKWTSETAWKLPEIGLSAGTNNLVIRGVDQWGKTLREEKFTVIRPAAPQ
ncbi:MAG: lamin tail domain-containing protein [Verrucomicrobia bacterium]|nr:lamin tail domain-containing protein [Verrucomicrobiota bacterium]